MKKVFLIAILILSVNLYAAGCRRNNIPEEPEKPKESLYTEAESCQQNEDREKAKEQNESPDNSAVDFNDFEEANQPAVDDRNASDELKPIDNDEFTDAKDQKDEKTSEIEYSDAAVCSHKWVEQYEEIELPEEGHFEDKEISPSWDEEVFERKAVCNLCGAWFDSEDDIGIHLVFEHDGGNYRVDDVLIATIHHDAEVERIWIVDSPAHIEKRLKSYVCSECGEEKNAE